MKVFVTGGNGFLGSRTVNELVRRGYSVRCLVRERSDLRRIRHLPIETHVGDVRDAASLEAGAEGCDAIIHLAGISSWEQIRREADQLDAVIVGGTRKVLQAARKRRVRRTVIVSSCAAVNGSRRPRLFTEESSYELGRSSLRYSVAKRRMEEAVTEVAQKEELDTVVVNPCEVYGPEDDGMVTAGNLIDLLNDGPALVCEGGTAVAHVDDIANGIVLALEKGRKGERYILGGENLTLREMAETVRRVAGKSRSVITLPNALAVAVCKGMASIGLNPPVSLDVLDYATLYWFVDSSKAMRELGYQPRGAEATFKDVVQWLIDTRKVATKTSLRYGGGSFDARSALIRLFGKFQRRKVVILDSNPKLCGEILASSDTKGTFIEQLIATPAWHPIYSIESVDGERWKQLSTDFKQLIAGLGWREKLQPLARARLSELARDLAAHPEKIVDSEAIARVTLRVLFELLFGRPIPAEDETLFYQASIQWRKEIAVKGKADPQVKAEFWKRLAAHVEASAFKDGLESYRADPSCWLSLFAQPFLISPQINFGDIFVTVFDHLQSDPRHLEQARRWAAEGDKARLGGILLEAIRLKHPFPIFEREMKKDYTGHGHHFAAGTQVFMIMDQFKQDQAFDPERWLQSPSENPYYAIPFAAGPRMCIGKPIAMELLVEMLRGFVLDFQAERIRPRVGHLYSGRDNDGKDTLSQTIYQLGVFARGLWKSFWIGRGHATGQCPFQRTKALLAASKNR